MQEFGYGDTASFVSLIAKQDQFRFDYYMKSRNAVELQRRCDTLVRIIEKELDGKEEEATVVSTGTKRKAEIEVDNSEEAAPVSAKKKKKIKTTKQ